MRTRILVALSLFSAACARPVLYYPTSIAPTEPTPSGETVNAPSGGRGAGPGAAAAIAVPDATAVSNPVVGVAATEMDYLRSRHLQLPVAGISPASLEDSFDQPRDGERKHNAIDIMAPRGTPILSADDGLVLRLSNNALGGTSLFTVDPAGRVVYYYAHLDRYQDGIVAGKQLAKGDTLGFVGTTGNAPKNLPHLHFQIMQMPADRKYWSGEPIDPFTLLGGVQHEIATKEHKGKN